jgi:HD-GYP domain-containing protein (c-di-GMP phosphodiesterase class II)
MKPLLKFMSHTRKELKDRAAQIIAELQSKKSGAETSDNPKSKESQGSRSSSPVEAHRRASSVAEEAVPEWTLIIVHAGVDDDNEPTMGDINHVIQPAAEMLINSGLFGDRIFEIVAETYPLSSLHHGGVVLVQPVTTEGAQMLAARYRGRGAREVRIQKAPDDYSYGGIIGTHFVLIGGGYAFCHLTAFTQLLVEISDSAAVIVIPRDAVYKNCQSGGEGDILPDSRLTDISDIYELYFNLAGQRKNTTLEIIDRTTQFIGEARASSPVEFKNVVLCTYLSFLEVRLLKEGGIIDGSGGITADHILLNRTNLAFAWSRVRTDAVKALGVDPDHEELISLKFPLSTLTQHGIKVQFVETASKDEFRANLIGGNLNLSWLSDKEKKDLIYALSSYYRRNQNADTAAGRLKTIKDILNGSPAGSAISASSPVENQQVYLNFTKELAFLLSRIEREIKSYGIQKDNFEHDPYEELYSLYKKLEPLFVLYQEKRQHSSFAVSHALFTVIRRSVPEDMYEHTVRVERLTRKIINRLVSKGLKVSKGVRAIITIAARLHDLGKLFFTKSIFSSARPLSSLNEPEQKVIKAHPVWGAEILKLIDGFKDIWPIVLYHHEHLDGSGYPEGLRGEAIPFGARIIAVVDTFDAMTSQRRYEEPSTIGKALAYLYDNSGKLFDAQVVEAIIAIHFPNKGLSKAEFTNRSEVSSPVEKVTGDTLPIGTRSGSRLASRVSLLGASVNTRGRMEQLFFNSPMDDRKRRLKLMFEPVINIR